MELDLNDNSFDNMIPANENMITVAIWLDDLRDPFSYEWSEIISMHAPETEIVLWAKNYEEFVSYFCQVNDDPTVRLVAVFFDNDLGPGKEGRHAFTWMEEQVREKLIPSFILHAHTSNPSARKELNGGFESLRRFWWS